MPLFRDLETEIALKVNEELRRQIYAKEEMDTLHVTARVVALPCIQALIRAVTGSK